MEKTKRWTDISGTAKVFRNEKNGRVWYSTSLSKKIGDNWQSMYIAVKFVGNAIPLERDTADITINSGFLANDPYEGKNGVVNNMALVVTDYDIMEARNERKNTRYNR